MKQRKQLESVLFLMTRLDTLMNLKPFSGYLYAYPHKTSYRHVHPPVDLAHVWKHEPMGSLFLYIHIPFCEMRCGFCNLFTMTGAGEDKVSAFLKSLRKEAETIKRVLPNARFSQIAIGGGTPTLLSAEQLDELFDIINALSNQDIPISIESSPALTTPDRLNQFEKYDVTRVSLGVESFSQEHLRAMGRPARAEDTLLALDNIRTHTTADLNIDIIYGAQGQSVPCVLADLKRAIEWSPEEIFIYPLYVGPLTGLSKRHADRDDFDSARLDQYRAARGFLLSAGYRQSSMRRFVRPQDVDAGLTEYSCQEDGMIGLGAGARSYTQAYHYSSDYAVGRKAISSIIDDYIACEDYSKIRYGIQLTREEQCRRYVIKSILNADGLNLAKYQSKFSSPAFIDVPDLRVLIDAEYLTQTATHLTPTSLGFERADAMGPFLTSESVKQAMRAYEWA